MYDFMWGLLWLDPIIPYNWQELNFGSWVQNHLYWWIPGMGWAQAY